MHKQLIISGQTKERMRKYTITIFIFIRIVYRQKDILIEYVNNTQFVENSLQQETIYKSSSLLKNLVLRDSQY